MAYKPLGSLILTAFLINAIQGVIPVFMNRALRSEPIEVWGDGTSSRFCIFQMS